MSSPLPTCPTLEEKTILIWATDVERWMASWEWVTAPLDEWEQTRLHAMRDIPTRKTFGVSRGLLRRLLGHYANCAPEAISFAYGDEGKPSVAGPVEAKTLRFNVSHSGGTLLIALARNIDVGVDLERIRPRKGLDALARRYFSQAEQIAMKSAPEAERPRVFFSIWCRKEACLKAIGRGVTYPLATLDFAEPGSVTITLCEGTDTTIHVSDVKAPFPSCAVAVASMEESCTIRTIQTSSQIPLP